MPLKVIEAPFLSVAFLMSFLSLLRILPSIGFHAVEIFFLPFPSYNLPIFSYIKRVMQGPLGPDALFIHFSLGSI